MGAVVGAMVFAVLLVFATVLEYLVGPVLTPVLGPPFDLPLILALISLSVIIYTVHRIIAFDHINWEDHRHGCKVFTALVALIVVSGLTVSALVFITEEPYHNWEYEVDLSCSVHCSAVLPVPAYEDDGGAFFDDRDIALEGNGSGQMRLVEAWYEGAPTPGLEVNWSGNITLTASGERDHRPLPMESFGLWDVERGRFVVLGKSIPEGDEVLVDIYFDHDRVGLEYENVQWTLRGSIGQGKNLLDPEGM